LPKQPVPVDPMQPNSAFSPADQIQLQELVSFGFLVSNPEEMRIFIQRLKAFVPFTHFAFLICPLDEHLLPKHLDWHLTNYPEQYVQNYLEEQAYYVDLVVWAHFREAGFGVLQHWQDTYQAAQAQLERGELSKELYDKHLKFLDYVREWGILADGYSIGYRGLHPKSGEPVGSILSVADGLETTKRTEQILTEIGPYLHQMMVRIFLSPK